MKDFLNKLYQNHSLIYKIFLFIITTVAIVYLFPKGGHFGLDIQKGKIWQSDNLYAPFDFAIQKSDDEIDIEKEAIEKDKQLYFAVNKNVFERVRSNYSNGFNSLFPDTLLIKYKRNDVIFEKTTN